MINHAKESIQLASIKSIAFGFSIGLCLFGVAAQANEPAGVTLPRQQLEPFLTKHCVRCHGTNEQNADVRFDEANWTITTNDVAQRWQDVLDQLNGGDMPPREEPQPTNDELRQALEKLTGSLQRARRQLNDRGGDVAMRRLNRREYAATIRDLFGFVVPEEMIPEDGEAASYDTVGSEQFFTSSHFDKYLELGREVVAQGFALASKPRDAVSSNRREPEEHVTPRLREKLADLDEKMRMKKAGKSWREMGFADEGEMQIVFSQFANRAGKPRKYLQYPLVESGIYLAEVNNETRRFGTNRVADPRGTYRYKVRAGIEGDPPEIRKFVLVTDKSGTVGVARVKGTAEAPEVIEMPYQPKIGSRAFSLQVQENRADIRVLDGYLNRIDKGGQWASIWIDWVEIEGPFYPPNRAFFETLVHPKSPVRGKRTTPLEDKNARDLIERFTFEAFRHVEPSAKYVDQLLAIFRQNRADAMNFEEAMTETLAITLASPAFLFLQESSVGAGRAKGEGAHSGNGQLNDREFAIRLSYFLWSSPPDAQLYACVANGSLNDPKVLKAQVDRMLDDPKAEAFFEGFASQWAELDRFNAITVDESDFFRFNKGVRYAAYREVIEFFKTLVTENLPASNLIASEFVVVNSLLGEHYEIAGADSDAYQKVSLPSESPRGGLLGQTAFLTLGSNGERSSPVIRGALVMEKLLHDKPAPPPPNVPELGSASNEPATNRKMVELHQQQAVCASCHKKMDVIGFGLENFDPIGKWRETEKVGRKEVPIEPGGTLPSGEAFKDVSGLKAVLLQQHHRLGEELVESMLAYGIGRTMEFSDSEVIAAISDRCEEDQYRLRNMIHRITSCELFRAK